MLENILRLVDKSLHNIKCHTSVIGYFVTYLCFTSLNREFGIRRLDLVGKLFKIDAYFENDKWEYVKTALVLFNLLTEGSI